MSRSLSRGGLVAESWLEVLANIKPKPTAAGWTNYLVPSQSQSLQAHLRHVPWSSKPSQLCFRAANPHQLRFMKQINFTYPNNSLQTTHQPRAKLWTGRVSPASLALFPWKSTGEFWLRTAPLPTPPSTPHFPSPGFWSGHTAG